MDNCVIRTKKLLSHAKKIVCCLCKNIHHMKCITLSTEYTEEILHGANTWYCGQCLSSIFPFNALENDLDFLSAIADLTLTNGQSMSYLTEKLFIPFELNDKDQASVLCDSDPDLHYYNSFNQLISKCDYFLESSFNENYEKLRSSGNVFSLCHMNIRSMGKNIHQFETYLDLLKHKFTVIGLTETWLKESNCDLYGIKGYQISNILMTRWVYFLVT